MYGIIVCDGLVLITKDMDKHNMMHAKSMSGKQHCLCLPFSLACNLTCVYKLSITWYLCCGCSDVLCVYIVTVVVGME